MMMKNHNHNNGVYRHRSTLHAYIIFICKNFEKKEKRNRNKVAHAIKRYKMVIVDTLFIYLELIFFEIIIIIISQDQRPPAYLGWYHNGIYQQHVARGSNDHDDDDDGVVPLL